MPIASVLDATSEYCDYCNPKNYHSGVIVAMEAAGVGKRKADGQCCAQSVDHFEQIVETFYYVFAHLQILDKIVNFSILIGMIIRK